MSECVKAAYVKYIQLYQFYILKSLSRFYRDDFAVMVSAVVSQILGTVLGWAALYPGNGRFSTASKWCDSLIQPISSAQHRLKENLLKIVYEAPVRPVRY